MAIAPVTMWRCVCVASRPPALACRVGERTLTVPAIGSVPIMWRPEGSLPPGTARRSTVVAFPPKPVWRLRYLCGSGGTSSRCGTARNAADEGGSSSRLWAPGTPRLGRVMSKGEPVSRCRISRACAGRRQRRLVSVTARQKPRRAAPRPGGAPARAAPWSGISPRSWGVGSGKHALRLPIAGGGSEGCAGGGSRLRGSAGVSDAARADPDSETLLPGWGRRRPAGPGRRRELARGSRRAAARAGCPTPAKEGRAGALARPARSGTYRPVEGEGARSRVQPVQGFLSVLPEGIRSERIATPLLRRFLRRRVRPVEGEGWPGGGIRPAAQEAAAEGLCPRPE